jgi:hypothetical protein
MCSTNTTAPGAASSRPYVHAASDVQRCRGIAAARRSAGELLRPLERAIRDDRGAHALIHQAFERQLGHLAGAEDHRALSLQRTKDLLGYLHGRRAHRRGAARDRRFVPDASRDEQRRLKETIEHRPGVGAAYLPRVSHLSVDLRLAENHRIETACHAKEMRDRIPVSTDVAELWTRRGRACRERGSNVPERCRVPPSTT